MAKESVKKFDLEAAFKALDEIEIPQVKGIKANRVNLKERFAQKSATETLVEDYYDVSNNEDLEEAQEEREGEVAQAKLARIEKIVDLDAESPEDLLPSYVGKVIMQCPQCMTLFYKNPEDIEHSEENPDVVNINEICQHCGNTSGYTLIGKVGAVSEEEASEYQAEEAPAEEENELDLDFDTEEPAEEEAPAEENAEGEEDLDLDLELEEIPEEEGTNESLNLSKEAPSDSETEHKSENLTLNEEVTDESLNKSEEAPSEHETENGSEETTLNEEVDKDLDAKLKAHNDYIAYLQQMIKQEEEALKRADNEEIKAAIQRRLDAFTQDLHDALPDVLKDEPEANEVAAEEPVEAPAEEPAEEVSEEEPAEEPADEALTEEAEEPKEKIGLIDLSGSLIEAEEKLVKQAKADGCTKLYKSSQQGSFEKLYNFAKANADADLVVYTNDDINYNPFGKEIKALSNVKIVNVGETGEVEESLNKSEAAPSEEETENKSENETLNEGLELNEEGNAKWNALSTKAKNELSKIKDDPKWEATDKYIIYGTDVNGKVLETREASGKPADAKATRDALLKDNEKVIDVYVSQYWRNKETKEEKEVELDGYMASRDGYKYTTEELKEDAEPNDAAKALDDYLKDEEPKEECLKEADSQEDTEAKLANFEADLQTENLKEASDIDSILDDYIKSLPEDLEECGNKLQEAPKFDDVSDDEFKQMLNSETFNEAVKIEESNLPSRAVINAIADRIRHAGDDYVEENLEECNKQPVEECGETPKAEEPLKEAKNEEMYIVAALYGDGGDNQVYYIGYDYKAALKEYKKDAKDWVKYGLGGGDTAVALIQYNGDKAPFDKAIAIYTEKNGDICFYDYFNENDCDILEETWDEIDESLKEADEEAAPVEEVPAEEEPAEEPQPIETTVEEVKEVATEVAEEVLETAEAEVEPEVVEEVVNEVVEDKLGEEKPEEGEAEEAEAEEPEFNEDDIDDLDECSLNKHIDEYLKEVYSNVKCFEATECKLHEGKLMVEGKISFNSGKEKLTMFEFLPAYCEGKLFFEGYNKDFSEDKAFTLNCSINESKTLITESFGYKYKINENLVEGLK